MTGRSGGTSKHGIPRQQSEGGGVERVGELRRLALTGLEKLTEACSQFLASRSKEPPHKP